MRLKGVCDACTDLGLPEPDVLTVPLTSDGAAAAVRQWRGGGEPTTGVCAYNDEVALALLAGMRTVGVSAPGGLAVVGADDIPAAALAAPPLTTVASDMPAIADYVARSIVCGLAGDDPPPRSEGDVVRMVVRESA
jgi:DNA-binding LacI/PurR family transcriptional regulator